MRNKSLLLLLITGTYYILLTGCSNHKIMEETSQMTNESTTPSNTPITDVVEKEASDITLNPDESASSVKEYLPSEDYVKLLGRTYLLGDTLWLAFSASGIEFTFTGTKADITFIGDNIATTGWAKDSFCRYGIYINDELVVDELMQEPEKTVTVFESDSEETVTVRIIKLSEAANSTLGIGKISVVAKEPIQPGKAKSHRIEFIGDSITCGFGVDDNDVNGAFTTATEDVTKAYAYQTAAALDADYSMVSFSGYGIISGYTDNGDRNENQLLPPYYDKLGFSYGFFNSSLAVASIDWDFSRFIPELIVINLGTNDTSYCGNDSERQKEFAEGYVTFIKQVREKNPTSTILCTLGMMGDTLYPSVENAVTTYKAESGDMNIYTMRFDVQQASDGFGACWHPSETTHTKAADKLTAEIKAIMGW